MAQTYKVQAKTVQGNARVNYVDFVADTTYVESNGYLLATADFEAIMEPGRKLTDMISFDSETNPGGYTIALDRTNSTAKWMLGGAQATTTISSTTCRVAVGWGFANFGVTP